MSVRNNFYKGLLCTLFAAIPSNALASSSSNSVIALDLKRTGIERLVEEEGNSLKDSGFKYLDSRVLTEGSYGTTTSNDDIDVDIFGLKVAVDGANGRFDWEVGEEDFNFSSLNGESFGVVKYIDNFSLDLSRKRGFVEMEKIIEGKSFLDIDISGVSLGSILDSVKTIDGLSEIRNGDNFFSYYINRSASAVADAKVNVENRFVSSEGDEVIFKGGAGGFANAFGAFNLNFDVIWKNDSLRNLAGKIEAGVEWKYKYDWEVGEFSEVSIKDREENSVIFGIVSKEAEEREFSQKYFVSTGAEVAGLNARAEYGKKRFKRNVKRKEDVIYGGFVFDRDNFLVGRNFGVRVSHIDSEEISNSEGKKFFVGMNGLSSEKVGYNVSSKESEGFVDLVYGGIIRARALKYNDLELNVSGLTTNYPFIKREAGVDITSDIFNGSVNSDGDYLAVINLWGKEKNLSSYFKKSLEDEASLAFGYLVKQNFSDGMRGGHVFVEKNDDLQKVGAGVISDNYFVEGGSIKDGNMRGFFAGIGIGGAKFRGSHLEGEDGKKELTRFNVDYETNGNWNIGGSGSFSGDEKILLLSFAGKF